MKVQCSQQDSSSRELLQMSAPIRDEVCRAKYYIGTPGMDTVVTLGYVY